MRFILYSSVSSGRAPRRLKLRVLAASGSDWDTWTTERQQEYLKEHPKSKRVLTDKGDKSKGTGKATTKPKPSVTIAVKKLTKAQRIEEVVVEKGKKVTKVTRLSESGEPLPRHVQACVLPPAWTDVEYSLDPEADLLVVGRDAAQRKQYVYNPRFINQQADAKHARIDRMAGEYPAMAKQITKDRKSTDPKIKDNADCLFLISKMGIRPGSTTDTKAKVPAIGATTLRGEHVTKGPKGEVRLKYIGKDGVPADLEVEDKELAAMITARAKAGGKKGNLFNAVNDKSVLDYSHGLGSKNYKTKDWRTLLANKEANDEIKRAEKDPNSSPKPPPKTEKEYRTMVNAVADKVAAKLNNTRSMALGSYINPSAFAGWRQSVTTHSGGKEESSTMHQLREAALLLATNDNPDSIDLPKVYFGSTDAEPITWDKINEVDPDDGDIEGPNDKPNTVPDYVIEMLGFDPLDGEDDNETNEDDENEKE